MSKSRREELRDFLKFEVPQTPVPYTVLNTTPEPEYRRLRIEYADEQGRPIPAYLLLPTGANPKAGVILHHQHNSEWHLGKSEVCGLAGNPLQAFGPALARRGLAVLAPDSICFEDRRTNRSGIEADPEGDRLQHFNAMCYRLVRGDLLMRQVLSDAARGVSVLETLGLRQIGALGHSYGGNTVLFQAALDERISVSAASGSAASYRIKIDRGTGIEMAEVIPGFASRFDIHDLVRCIAPRRLLVVSAEDDPYSEDAADLVESSRDLFPDGTLGHHRFPGSHPLTRERFEVLVDWISNQLGAATR